MLDQRRIAVVVPAYREARLICRTLRTLPDFVDVVIVVDDASEDGTSEAARSVADARVQVLRHATNRGVGAAIVSGYRAALAAGADVAAVMAGDAQMDPADLRNVVEPIVRGRADYVKGNRFRHPERRAMPAARRWAGRALALLTRAVSGLDVDDCQCGYTAISRRAVERLPLDELWPRFGYPNDLLILLAAHGFRVAEVPVRPIYADERSGVRPWHAAQIAALVFRRALRERRRRLPPLHDESARSTIPGA